MKRMADNLQNDLIKMFLIFIKQWWAYYDFFVIEKWIITKNKNKIEETKDNLKKEKLVKILEQVREFYVGVYSTHKKKGKDKE